MNLYRPMPLHLETERLRMRPWVEADAPSYSALTAERDVGAWNAASLRVLDKLGFERSHVAPHEDGKGTVIWLTRTLR